MSVPSLCHAHPSPRGRLAPSPTGRLHLGNAFAFLLAWLSMRAQGGTLLLRLEDIDPDRSRPAFAEAIRDDLAWLGLSWDEGPDCGGPYAPYVQSERLERYAAVLADLEVRGRIYPCYCTRKELRTLASAPHVGDEGAHYPGVCRHLSSTERAAKEASGRRACLRLDTAAALEALQKCQATDTPGDLLSFNDGVCGLQSYTLADCGGDFALRRSDGVYAYQLAVVADDVAMGVTEVLRGDDLLLSTPRQLLLLHLLGKQPPRYMHIPLLHDAKGERLAKRHKSLELAALRGAGVAPEAVIGYLAWLAGCLDKPQTLRPTDLPPLFDSQRLRGRVLTVPDDVTDLLRKL